MRKIIFSILICAIGVFAHGNNSHFENQQDIKVKTTKLNDKIYLLQGRGGNIGASVGTDGILLIDDDYKNISDKLKVALRELGSEKPKIIFNTHWHGDHTEGNFALGKDSIIIAHSNVRLRLSQINSVFGTKTEPYPENALPIITYEQSMSVYFNGEEIKAIHYPNGHTDGDTVVFFTKSNVVHLGDKFFANRFPFVDLENGGSVQGLSKNIDQLIQKIPADAKIIPGHGPICTIDDLKNYYQMLSVTSEVVQDGISKKKTLDEIIKAGLPEKYKSWGEGFIKTDFWITTIYKSLRKK
jgi:glyoxylase-like metal-dependent hydrolase (beta-lactamase superfamily II)